MKEKGEGHRRRKGGGEGQKRGRGQELEEHTPARNITCCSYPFCRDTGNERADPELCGSQGRSI